jgi:glycosyltransferase involved in cell wall biosynthesis
LAKRLADQASDLFVNPNRILIVTASHLCRNPRVVKEATTLGSAGYDVTVLTLSMTDRFEETDRSLIAPLPFRRIALDHRQSTAHWPNLRARGATWLARQLLRRTRIETASALGPARPLLERARALRADLTIAHNEIPLWIAQHLASDGRRVAADFEDWYSEDLTEHDRQTRPLKLLRAAERFALRHASASTTTSVAMAHAMTAAHGGSLPTVVRNVFPLQQELPRPVDESLPPGLVWFSQTVGPGRGLEFFVSAWNRTQRPSRLTLLGDVSRAFREKLLGLATPERRERITFLPFVSPSELPGTLAAFDVGLALELKEPRNRDLTITNKIFQYLNAGLAVVATPTTGQREVMQAAPDCGVLVPEADPARLTVLLDGLIGDRQRLRACQLAARAAAVREFCWEKESPRLLNSVRQALAK